MVVMTGNHDGSSEVDYTVNPSVGFPEAMGPRDSAVPTQQPHAGVGHGDGRARRRRACSPRCATATRPARASS